MRLSTHAHIHHALNNAVIYDARDYFSFLFISVFVVPSYPVARRIVQCFSLNTDFSDIKERYQLVL